MVLAKVAASAVAAVLISPSGSKGLAEIEKGYVDFLFALAGE